MTIFRQALSAIPQNPETHPEGNVWKHTYLVRYSLPPSLAMLSESAHFPKSPLSELDFNLTKEETDILRVAAWMHDIGKMVTTTFNIMGVHVPIEDVSQACDGHGRWQALEHERPIKFKKALRRLRNSMWMPIWQNSTFEAKKDVLFIIRHHMGLGHGDSRVGFGRRLSRKWITAEGKYKNKRRYKLLLAMVVMDRLGRTVPDAIESACEAIRMFEDGSNFAVRICEQQSLPAPNDPIQFLYLLRNKPERVLKSAFQGKFGRDATKKEMRAIQLLR